MYGIELKPCPFCGGRAVLHVDGGVSAICQKCGCRTEMLIDSYFGETAGGTAVCCVIEKWNKRVE